jgi:excisionase family DNA binding protein
MKQPRGRFGVYPRMDDVCGLITWTEGGSIVRRNMNSQKTVLTTGEVAKICSVAPRTVSKWFDSGQLRGYRIPGSKDRRIPLEQLVRFMRVHGIPLNGLVTESTSILVLDTDVVLWETVRQSMEQEGDYEVALATAAFEAGAMVKESRPQVLIVDVTLPDVVPRALALGIRTIHDVQDTRLIATAQHLSDGDGQALLQDGFDAFLAKPFHVRSLIEMIDRLTQPPANADFETPGGVRPLEDGR